MIVEILGAGESGWSGNGWRAALGLPMMVDVIGTRLQTTLRAASATGVRRQQTLRAPGPILHDRS